MTAKTDIKSESTLIRAIRASPLLIFAVVAAYGSDVTAHVPAFAAMVEKEQFNINGNILPIKRHFYGITELDNLVALLSTVFTQFISGFDPISYWQTFVFVTDCAGMYAIWLFESTRNANKWTPIYPYVYL
jgi:hypothetical protein